MAETSTRSLGSEATVLTTALPVPLWMNILAFSSPGCLPGDSGQDPPIEGTVLPLWWQQLRRHAPGGQSPPPVARLNQQVHVAFQEPLFHVDIFAAVWKQEGWSVT